MAKGTNTAKLVSVGKCNFCHIDIDKSKMTQHLKYCKQRKATVNATEAEKTKLFHIVVEGQYLPMYWMHLEIAADATLADLDDFLRAIWLECCGHLSEFRIGKASYSSQREGMSWEFADPQVSGEEETKEEEEEEEAGSDNGIPEGISAEEQALIVEELINIIMDQLADDFRTPMMLAFASQAEVEAKLKDLLVKMSNSPLPPEVEAEIGNLARGLQLAALSRPSFHHHDMGFELGEVLTVGQKFTHEYDFGSTTYLALRVVAEREGVLLKDEDGEEDPFFIMARNDAPTIPCRVCGQPATRVAMGYYSVEEGAMCDACAKKRENLREYEDSFLPIVNSPRTGVCGYTGESEGWYDEGEWDEDEEDDEEEE